VKDTVLGKDLVDPPRNSGNAWQDRYDATFLQAHFPTYEAKTLKRKGKEFAAQCTDQYIKLFTAKCRKQFDPSLGENDPITDQKGWDAWKRKKAQVCLPPFLVSITWPNIAIANLQRFQAPCAHKDWSRW
jgi:hypothetical protein